MGTIFSGIAKLAAVVVVGPAALPLLMAGDWNGIDGYDGGCDEQSAQQYTTRMGVTYRQRGIDA